MTENGEDATWRALLKRLIHHPDLKEALSEQEEGLSESNVDNEDDKEEEKEKKEPKSVEEQEVSLETLEKKLEKALLLLRLKMWPASEQMSQTAPVVDYKAGPIWEEIGETRSSATRGLEGHSEALIGTETFKSGAISYCVNLRDTQPDGELGWHVSHTVNGTSHREFVRLKLSTGVFSWGDQRSILALPPNFQFRPNDYIGCFIDIDRLAFRFTVNDVRLPEVCFRTSDSWNTSAPTPSNTPTPISSATNGTTSSNSATSSSATSSAKGEKNSTPLTKVQHLLVGSYLKSVSSEVRTYTVQLGKDAVWRASGYRSSMAKLKHGHIPYFCSSPFRPLVDTTSGLKSFESQCDLILSILYSALEYMPRLSDIERLDLKPSSSSSSKTREYKVLKTIGISKKAGGGEGNGAKLKTKGKHTLQTIYDEGAPQISKENAQKLIDLLIYSRTVGLRAVAGKDVGSPFLDGTGGQWAYLLRTSIHSFLVKLRVRNLDTFKKNALSHFLSLLKEEDMWTDSFLTNVIVEASEGLNTYTNMCKVVNAELVAKVERKGTFEDWVKIFYLLACSRRCVKLFSQYYIAFFHNNFAAPTLDHRIRLEPYVAKEDWYRLDDLPKLGSNSNCSLQSLMNALSRRHWLLGQLMYRLVRYHAQDEHPEEEEEEKKGEPSKESKNEEKFNSDSSNSAENITEINDSSQNNASQEPLSSSAASSPNSEMPPLEEVISASSDSTSHSGAENGAPKNEKDENARPSSRVVKPPIKNEALNALRTVVNNTMERGKTAAQTAWAPLNGLLFALLAAIGNVAPEVRNTVLNNVLYSDALQNPVRYNVDRLGGTLNHVIKTYPNPLEIEPSATNPAYPNVSFPDAESGWIFELLDVATHLLSYAYVPAYQHMQGLMNEYEVTGKVAQSVAQARARRIREVSISEGLWDPVSQQPTRTAYSSKIPMDDLDTLEVANAEARSHLGIAHAAGVFDLLDPYVHSLLFYMSQWLSQAIIHTCANPTRSSLIYYFPEDYIHALGNLIHIIKPISSTSDYYDDPDCLLPSMREVDVWETLDPSDPDATQAANENSLDSNSASDSHLHYLNACHGRSRGPSPQTDYNITEELDDGQIRTIHSTNISASSSSDADAPAKVVKRTVMKKRQLWSDNVLMHAFSTLVLQDRVLNPNLLASILQQMCKLVDSSLSTSKFKLGPNCFMEFLDVCFTLFVDKRLMFWTIILDGFKAIVSSESENSKLYEGYIRKYVSNSINKKKVKAFLNKLFNLVNWGQNELDVHIDSYIEKLKLLTTNIDTIIAPPGGIEAEEPVISRSPSSAALSLDEQFGFGSYASRENGRDSREEGENTLRRSLSATFNAQNAASSSDNSSSAPLGFGPSRSMQTSSGSIQNTNPSQQASSSSGGANANSGASSSSSPGSQQAQSGPPQQVQSARPSVALEDRGFARSAALPGWVLVETGHAERVVVELPEDSESDRIELLRALTSVKSGIDVIVNEAPLYFTVVNQILDLLAYMVSAEPSMFESDALILTRTCEIVGHTMSRMLDMTGSPPTAKLWRLFGVVPKPGDTLPESNLKPRSFFELDSYTSIIICTRIVRDLLMNVNTQQSALSHLSDLIPRKTIELLLSFDSQISDWKETVGVAFKALKEHDNKAQREVLLRSGQEECPICYANPVNTTFVPCNHRSCGSCIERHLLNEKKCFFCKADITAIRKDGEFDLRVSMN